MTLDFSFGDIDPIWIPGQSPLGGGQSRKVRIHLSGTSNSKFPPFLLEVGDLLCGARAFIPDYYVTLLLAFPYGTVPVSIAPPEEGVWSPVPGSTIYAQIRIPLPEEAVRLIKEVDGGDEYSYELSLEDVDLRNKTKPRPLNVS